MNAKKVILVTGVSGFWGGQIASLLASSPDYHVIGLDSIPPQTTIKGLDFIQADVRNARLLDLLREEQVHTMVHLAFIESRQPNEHAFETNVLGTMKVFAACREAGVQKIVVRSSTAVYGARPANSAFLRESHPLRGSTQTGWIRDLVEVEAFCNGFGLQAPEICLTVLRFPNVVGPNVPSPMTRYLKQRVPPVLLGFEPQMQFLHETDAIAALLHVIKNDVPGVFNVAAEYPISLDKALAITGKMPAPVFHLFAYWGSAAFGSHRLDKWLPFDLDYLRYPWVGDLQRMRTELNFTPQFSAEDALRDFASQQRLSTYKPAAGDPANEEDRLKETIEHRSGLRQSGQSDQAMIEDEDQEEETNE